MIPPDATLTEDDRAFTPMFSGALRGWDGDTTLWSADNRTSSARARRRSGSRWRGGRPRDLELKAEIRPIGIDSGIQLRGTEMPEVGRRVPRGYQAGSDFTGGDFANVHEERMRTFLAQRGTMTGAETDQRPRIVTHLDEAPTIEGLYPIGGWNRYHIIARGNVLTLIVYGRVTAILIDDDLKNRSLQGMIGVQLRTSPPFRGQYRCPHRETLRSEPWYEARARSDPSCGTGASARTPQSRVPSTIPLARSATSSCRAAPAAAPQPTDPSGVDRRAPNPSPR